MKNAAHFLFSLVLLNAYSNVAAAAACCGGNVAVPSLITGDDRAQVTATTTWTSVETDVYDTGLWKDRTDPETDQVLKLDSAWLVSDRWQLGSSLPLVRRSRDIQDGSQSATGLGDISVDVGYEYLPEWDYSWWKPKGVGFFEVTAPTGKSIYQSNDPQALDVTGRGFWAVGLGTVLTKVIGHYDFLINGEFHRSLARNVNSPQVGGNLQLSPGWGGNFGLGGGWSKRAFRVGTLVDWTYEDPIQVRGIETSQGAPQQYATVSIIVSYMVNDEWSANLGYSDQKWIGTPINTPLGQSLFASLMKQWPR